MMHESSAHVLLQELCNTQSDLQMRYAEHYHEHPFGAVKIGEHCDIAKCDSENAHAWRATMQHKTRTYNEIHAAMLGL